MAEAKWHIRLIIPIRISVSYKLGNYLQRKHLNKHVSSDEKFRDNELCAFCFMVYYSLAFGWFVIYSFGFVYWNQ